MITPVLAQAVASRLLPAGASPRLMPLTCREGRAVYRVDTAAGACVLKLDARAGAFAREAAALARLGAHGLPVGRVLARRDGPPSALLLPWTEGVSLTGDSPPGAVQQVGRLLRRVHGLGGAPPSAAWAEWMRGWLIHGLRYGEASGHAPPGLFACTEAWFSSLWPLLHSRGRDLMLMDGRPEHWLVAPNGRVALIDVAELCPGDGLMDLALLGLWEPSLLAGVLHAYAPTPQDAEAAPRLLPFYTFLRALAAAEWDRNHLGGGQERRWLDVAWTGLRQATD